MQPVPSMPSVSIDRQLLVFQGVPNDQRDKLLRKLKRPVVVRASDNQHRHIIGAPIGETDQISRRLARRVWTARPERAVLQGWLSALGIAVDFIRGNLHETIHAGCVGRLEQYLGPDHVRRQERPRIQDAPVHMRLSGKVYDSPRALMLEQLVHELSIANVASHKLVASIILDVLEPLRVPRVRQLVQIDHAPGPPTPQQPDEMTPHEPAATRNQDRLHPFASYSKLLSAASSGGSEASFCERIGFRMGHEMPIRGSLQRIPLSSTGSCSAVNAYMTSASPLRTQKPCANPSGTYNIVCPLSERIALIQPPYAGEPWRISTTTSKISPRTTEMSFAWA